MDGYISRRKRIGIPPKKCKYRILEQNESYTCGDSMPSIKQENISPLFEEKVVEDGHQQQDHKLLCSGPGSDPTAATTVTKTEPGYGIPKRLENESDTLEDVCETMDTLSFYDGFRSALSSVVTFPYQMNSCSENIQILELYPSVSQPTVKLSVTIGRNLKARLFVHQIELSRDHEFWIGLPDVFDTPMKVTALLGKLNDYSVCIGSPDECFQSMVEIGDHIKNNAGDTTAYREGDFKAVKGVVAYSSTIRHIVCKFLVQGARCQPCSKVRHMLDGRKRRQDEKLRQLENRPVTDIDYIEKKSRHVDMDRKALIDKLKQQKRMITRIQDELKRQQKYCGQEVEPQDHDHESTLIDKKKQRKRKTRRIQNELKRQQHQFGQEVKPRDPDHETTHIDKLDQQIGKITRIQDELNGEQKHFGQVVKPQDPDHEAPLDLRFCLVNKK